MFRSDQYELIDFGAGRKLERFGAFVLDREAGSAVGTDWAAPAVWRQADARFRRTAGQRGRWTGLDRLPADWNVQHGSLVFQLQPSPVGHLGLFPEQAENWDWIAGRVRSAERPLKVLNLFAYTGGSTLAAAAAGAEVVHVDAAKNVVSRARGNAELSGLAAAPIRWIVEDAADFVRREVRRGNRYDAVILDPPSYGHGPKGQAWKLAQHLQPLLESCRELTAPGPALAVLSCHSPGFGPAQLSSLMAKTLLAGCRSGTIEAAAMRCTTGDGRELACGTVVRWSFG